MTYAEDHPANGWDNKNLDEKEDENNLNNYERQYDNPEEEDE